MTKIIIKFGFPRETLNFQLNGLSFIIAVTSVVVCVKTECIAGFDVSIHLHSKVRMTAIIIKNKLTTTWKSSGFRFQEKLRSFH